MERITPDTLAVLQQRFGRLHDAVIHSITFGLFTDQRPSSTTIRMVIGAPDLETTTSPTRYEFVNIEFTLVGAVSFALIKAWNYDVSVIFHMDIHLRNDQVYFVKDLSDADPDEISFKDFIGDTSSVFLAAKEAYYSILPYETRDF